ncbi:hypothetical protein NPA07_01550 [Mycoplasmopsis caviae]|uniref:Uncharacterized protein n=1 Tax=Mycoplasmopsis caviae TaxID=55603 RepID=A0A3P8K8K6_9BACT|nr:hypothetical protein [Mycoplasmopsis caviae]UUD35540.1 hypothetical protein NPA07_01550 [Mycoplasmopsis caviae]VDR41689.1 Uncharacterised protein [Mycoplasmopsis caviae]
MTRVKIIQHHKQTNKQTQSEIIKSAKAKLKRSIEILKTNNKKYTRETLNELKKSSDETIKTHEPLLTKEDTSLEEVNQSKDKVDNKITELELQYNKLKVDKEQKVKRYNQVKNELNNLIIEAKKFKEQSKKNNPDISFDKLESIINDAENELTKPNATEESLDSIKNKLASEITNINRQAKEQLDSEIKVAELEIEKFENKKYFASLKSELESQIAKVKKLSLSNKEINEYKKALEELKASQEKAKLNKAKIENVIQDIENAKNYEELFKEKNGKKLFEGKINDLKQKINAELIKLEDESLSNLSTDQIVNKLSEIKENISNQKATFVNETDSLKTEYNEYLKQWQKVFDEIKSIENKITNLQNKEELMKIYNSSNEYSLFINEENIKNYNIESKNELERITEKVLNDLSSFEKKYINAEIKSFLERIRAKRNMIN